MNSEIAQHQQLPNLLGLLSSLFSSLQPFISSRFCELRNRRRMVFCNGLTHHVHYLRDEYEKYW